MDIVFLIVYQEIEVQFLVRTLITSYSMSAFIEFVGIVQMVRTLGLHPRNKGSSPFADMVFFLVKILILFTAINFVILLLSKKKQDVYLFTKCRYRLNGQDTGFSSQK